MARQTQTADGSIETDNASDAIESDASPSDTNDFLSFDDMDTEEANLIDLPESDDETTQSQPKNNNNNDDRGYCFGNEFYFQIKLMKILHNANAPNYLYLKEMCSQVTNCHGQARLTRSFAK